MASEYYHSKESVDEYIQLAADHNGKDLIEKLKPFLSKNSCVLEIGTGPGSDFEILSENYRVTGSDLSIEFLERLKFKFPNANFLELDASSLLVKDSFDAIYSNKVLHHLTDDQLEKSIQRQAEITNPEGIICHSFWKGEGTENFKGMFVNYHLEEELVKLYGEYFDILLLETYQEFEPDDSILLIAKKKNN